MARALTLVMYHMPVREDVILPLSLAALVEATHAEDSAKELVARGADVELYGYAALPSQDSLFHIGETAIDGSLGAFTVARGFLDNPRPVELQLNAGPSIPIGVGLDETWTGELELADPVPTAAEPPLQNEPLIAEGFPSAGGYALLLLGW